MKIPIARTNLLDSEIDSVLEPLKSGWLVQGPKVNEFEDKWSEFTDTSHSVAVSSCTSAMHLSLAAMGFGVGDEAIVPAFTWISTANVVEHLGGKVVFCDIDLNTFNIDTDQLESKVTEKTKVILPVHLFGLSADIDPILEVTQKYNLNLVEDIYGMLQNIITCPKKSKSELGFEYRINHEKGLEDLIEWRNLTL